MPQRAYDVTILEQVVHTFTITVNDDEDPVEAAEEEFLNCPHDELENYGEAVVAREVENVTPR